VTKVMVGLVVGLVVGLSPREILAQTRGFTSISRALGGTSGASRNPAFYVAGLIR